MRESTPQALRFFKPIIQDYIQGNPKTEKFLGSLPSRDNILSKAKIRLAHYNHRKLLVDVINQQHSPLDLFAAQKKNLALLAQENCCTITTGHQLNLNTGPLFTFTKALQVIKLAQELNQTQTEIAFIPLFWMATEDHDYQEVNHFHMGDKTCRWEKDYQGAVGRMSTDGMEELLKKLEQELPKTQRASEIKKKFMAAYLLNKNWSDAFRQLIHSWMGEKGLLILDADDARLKQPLVPIIKDELFNQTLHIKVKKTNQTLKKENYNIQVNPRDINLFYLTDDLRSRLVEREHQFHALYTENFWSKEELIKEIENHPERFSPNALLRPVYQEIILPNAVYIGGGGELAYWAQLKDYFQIMHLSFPILVLRNHCFLYSNKWKHKVQKLGFQPIDFLSPKDKMMDTLIKRKSKLKINFDSYERQIQEIYDEIMQLSEQTDATLKNLVAAKKKQQENTFSDMRKRLLKAEKRVYNEELKRLEKLYETVYPNGKQQERQENILSFYLSHGENVLNKIYAEIHPMAFDYIPIEL